MRNVPGSNPGTSTYYSFSSDGTATIRILRLFLACSARCVLSNKDAEGQSQDIEGRKVKGNRDAAGANAVYAVRADVQTLPCKHR